MFLRLIFYYITTIPYKSVYQMILEYRNKEN